MDRNDKVREIAEVICAAEHGGQCLSHCDFSCDVKCTNYAKALIDKGYHRTIWHKVTEGDLPKNDSLVLAFYKPGYYSTKLYLKNADGEGWWYGKSKCKTEDIIAWTELPTYVE